MDGSTRRSDEETPLKLLNEGLFRQILDTADDAVISVDQTQQIVLFNQGAERIFGYTACEALGRKLDLLLPRRFIDAHRMHIRDFSRSSTTSRRMAERSEITGLRKDGSEFPAEASISRVGVDGLTVYTVILRDITQRKAAEKRIHTSLREKEILLQEVHHRVKNNLQVISSLLSLQSRGIDNEPTRQHFQEIRQRVQTIALIHEQLYMSENFCRRSTFRITCGNSPPICSTTTKQAPVASSSIPISPPSSFRSMRPFCVD